MDRKAKILAVAHCDWVKGLPVHFSKAVLTDETLIFSPQLDDRLGVYTVLDLLPSMGVKADVLLTDDEEIGRSTAKIFDTDKKYNWIVEFDRRGTGAVMYQYDFPCREYFRVDHGSFSDICCLDRLGVQGINIGVAYHDEHTSRCYMVLEDYANQMVRFNAMYKALRNARLPYEKPAYKKHASFGLYSWPEASDTPAAEAGEKDDENIEVCTECGQWGYVQTGQEIYGAFVCEDCVEEAFYLGDTK